MKIKAIRREIYEILWIAMAIIKIMIFGLIVGLGIVFFVYWLAIKRLYDWLFKKK